MGLLALRSADVSSPPNVKFGLWKAFAYDTRKPLVKQRIISLDDLTL